MHHLVLLVTAAALLGECWSANVRRHLNIPEIDNDIEPHVNPSKHPVARKFITITKRPSAINQHEPGTTIELTCEAIGAPAPNVHWFKNDAPVYEHDVESNELFSDSNPSSLARVTSTLLVSKTKGQDQYTCLVAAGSKTAKASTLVYSTGDSTDLTERSKLVPLSPRILVSYKVFVDTIGSNIVLPCKAKGHPKPHFVWRDNKGIDVKKNPRMRVLRSGELQISSLRWSDMGEFSCQAKNVFGSQIANTFVYPAKAG